MKKLICLILITAVVALNASAVVSRKVICQSTGDIEFVVDSIDFRKELTRVYGKIKGRPHTANRIDNMTLTGKMSPEGTSWIDVEGVDMNRWFQWEDSGEIGLEIDFGPCRNRKGISTVIVSGPKGTSKWVITLR